MSKIVKMNKDKTKPKSSSITNTITGIIPKTNQNESNSHQVVGTGNEYTDLGLLYIWLS